jgi:primosomal protein N' (replication factor Y)
MTRRVGDRPLPKVEMVDMAREHTERKAFCLLSRRLEQQMRSVLERGEQVLLFLNRRGYATIVRCKRCGHVASCPRCEISCTFHRGIGRLLCHYCGHEEIPPDSCPECLMPGMKYQGLGTERIEQELERLFPGIPAARMDSDSMQGLGSYEKVLEAFRKGDVRILVGTQMVAKGHDFPSVTLVGIVLADTSLHVPDFRSAERTFQLVAQASGRSGRGHRKGRVVLQTYAADHFALRTGAEQDFLAFAEKELENRKALGYPPFGKLGRIVARSADQEAASQRIGEARRIAVEATRGEATVLGPAPLFRLRGEHRFQLLIKAKMASSVHRGLRAVRRQNQNDRKVHLTVDMDPQG